MPVYNREKFLDKAIHSVLDQTHENFHLVIVDDCSTDGSLDISKQYESLSNVTLLRNKKNMGCYHTRNHALYKFKGEDWGFFTIHDSDDYSDPERFREIVKPFSNPDLLGLKTTYSRVDENGSPQKDRMNPNKLDVYSSEGIAIFPRKTFDILGYYDDTRFSGDTDYWWRLERFCALNPKYLLGKHMLKLYSAVSHDENLTKIYNFETDRPKYFSKSRLDIENMTKTGSFRREFEL